MLVSSSSAGCDSVAGVGTLRFGPSGLPEAESYEESLALLAERGYTACELGFAGGFRLDYETAARLGELARAADVALSVHAPLAAFLGHAERGKKLKMAIGMLDHTSGLAKALGAAPIVVHPGFFLGRTREETLDAVCEQCAELHARLEAKDRLVPLGFEVMGRVRDFGSVDDVIEIARRCAPLGGGFVRPVLDFAHMHATSDGAYLDVEPFAAALAACDEGLPPGVPFHLHFSDIRYANRNETWHLPYGEGTLRAEPLREALERFERPATVISESPDEASTQAILAVLNQ
jgi:deoxyribonuclease-4